MGLYDFETRKAKVMRLNIEAKLLKNGILKKAEIKPNQVI
jgi:hypothetical protein